MAEIKEFRVKRVTSFENYQMFKDGEFNTDELCPNFNFITGYSYSPEPYKTNTKPGASSYRVLKNN